MVGTRAGGGSAGAKTGESVAEEISEKMEEMEDIIGLLKAKEDEMETLLDGARAKAVRIKEETVTMADGIKVEAAANMVAEVVLLRKDEAARLALEVSRIEERGSTDAEKLARTARKKKDEAVRLVFEVLTNTRGVAGGAANTKRSAASAGQGAAKAPMKNGKKGRGKTGGGE